MITLSSSAPKQGPNDAGRACARVPWVLISAPAGARPVSAPGSSKPTRSLVPTRVQQLEERRIAIHS